MPTIRLAEMANVKTSKTVRFKTTETKNEDNYWHLKIEGCLGGIGV